jgi:solute carrier family 25 carnitine/acylcarnitine transporter 20/29
LFFNALLYVDPSHTTLVDQYPLEYCPFVFNHTNIIPYHTDPTLTHNRFGTYEVMKRSFVTMQGLDDPSKLSPLAVMTAGGLAGMACWGVSIPPDVLKSRFQTAPEGKYKGVFDVYRTLVKEEGYGALFTGFRPAMIRAFPANAACFLGMEMARKAFAFLD